MKPLKITFLDSTEYDLDPPLPAKKNLPEWYKNIASYIGELGKKPLPEPLGPSTVKKCLPVFDSLSLGYLITSPVDVYVVNDGKSIEFQYATLNYMTYHRGDQVTGYPGLKGGDMPKFITPWGIKTPPGYSCLFVPPMHRENAVLILPAVIDTDTYHLPVEFPFLLSDNKFSGLIPKGTPIAQVIPFKRDNWKQEYSNSKDNKRMFEKIGFVLKSTFFDAYKKVYWKAKNFD